MNLHKITLGCVFALLLGAMPLSVQAVPGLGFWGRAASHSTQKSRPSVVDSVASNMKNVALNTASVISSHPKTVAGVVIVSGTILTSYIVYKKVSSEMDKFFKGFFKSLTVWNIMKALLKK